jgi:uncharacterized protein (TIGR03643 family)
VTKGKSNSKLTLLEKDRVIEMAWEDRTPFSAIKLQFGLSESEVVTLMRSEMRLSSFKMWRKRVHSGVSLKHEMKRPLGLFSFKSSMQRDITQNKISKRMK